MSKGGRAGLAGLLVVLGLAIAPAAAQATAITVDSSADGVSSGCTLRDAITAANTNAIQGNCPAGQVAPTVDTIDFNLPSSTTIVLTSALPTITDDVNITGPGESQLTVSGNDLYQPFRVNAGKTAGISGLTVTHGLCGAACGFTGGGIHNDGDLTLSHVAVTSNDGGAQGGGIYNVGTLNITDSTVSGNHVTGVTFPEGGGIFNNGTLMLVRSTVDQNLVSSTGTNNQAAGGGIYNNDSSSVTLDRSTVSNNDSTGTGGTTAQGIGAGIINRANLTLLRSTVSGNTASASGASSSNEAFDAGISNINPASPADVTVVLDRTTLSDNTATAAGGSQGGGMEILPGVYTITSSTIAHNSADSISNLSFAGAAPGSSATIKNTIVSDPEGGGTNCSGTPTTSSYDISSDGTCGFTGTGDHLNTDPNLAPSLANNGGPTQTYALQSPSPAIDQGLSSAGETVDQRGIKRPSDFPSIANAPGGNGTDIGAFELSDPTAVIDSGASGVTYDPTPTFTFHANDGASTLQCKLDAGSFAPCASPKTTAHLVDGAHTLQVRARDGLGNFGPVASRSFTVKTASISRSGSTLVVSGVGGAKDNFKVTKPSSSTIRITNLPAGSFTASGVHVGLGCTRSGDYTANCGASGITLVKVASGAATDRVLDMSPLPINIDGGAGNDALTGGARADTIKGGPGSDVMQGNGGNDTLLARDNTSDAAINCDGPGAAGTADKAILDALPKDPNSIVSGCETKSRP